METIWLSSLNEVHCYGNVALAAFAEIEMTTLGGFFQLLIPEKNANIFAHHFEHILARQQGEMGHSKKPFLQQTHIKDHTQ